MSVIDDKTATDKAMQDLRDEVFHLRRIARVASALVSNDDDYDTMRTRFDTLRVDFYAANAAYYQRFGRGV